MNKKQAILKMNELGTDRIPFLFIIDFEMQKPLVFRFDEIDKNKIKFSFNDYSNYSDKISDNKIVINNTEHNFKSYKKAFNIVKKNILLGNSYLVNLTTQTPIEQTFSLNDVLSASNAKYKLLYKNEFIFFSPETFIKIYDGIISSYPMKGTIDADISDAENKILNDQKETAEHFTIVDLIRNDLNMVANNVKVQKFRYIDKIKTNKKNLLQVSSIITGELNDNYNEHLGDVIFKLLPAGSISGAPKKKTLEIINQAENYKRGYYTGVAGYFDGRNVDSCVMIRFIENIDGKYFYKSGGGITSFSSLKNEYQEVIDKIYIPTKN